MLGVLLAHSTTGDLRGAEPEPEPTGLERHRHAVGMDAGTFEPRVADQRLLLGADCAEELVARSEPPLRERNSQAVSVQPTPQSPGIPHDLVGIWRPARLDLLERDAESGDVVA